ncbi:hypothetical protein RCF98_14300 [Thiothrix lacustris]|uniref:Uncharacterized protein n=1 Tax=Thiothrix lacustris TaxID=525917 RepID=A0ABY9MNA5_9GAMM|nr:hypothetical protein [Thiothrix lacustris]WML90134.1 hypothetical protein RCF98_14300 [Thiothrix lacustris]
MNDHSKITEKLHSAIVGQWQEAINTDASHEWSYTGGFLAGFIVHDSENHDLMFLHSIAAQRAHMTAKGSTNAYATFTPQQRLDALSDTLSRMKSHSVILSQFFTRPATKQAAISGMNAEVENMLVLWEKIKADVEEMGAQQ